MAWCRNGAVGGDSTSDDVDPPLADLTREALMLALSLRNSLDGDDRDQAQRLVAAIQAALNRAVALDQE